VISGNGFLITMPVVLIAMSIDPIPFWASSNNFFTAAGLVKSA